MEEEQARLWGRYKAMRSSELKAVAAQRKLKIAHIYDKNDLIDLLVQWDCSPVTQDAVVQELPLRVVEGEGLEGRQLVVEAYVSGRRTTWLVTTGLSVPVMDKQRAAELGLDGVTSKRDAMDGARPMETNVADVKLRLGRRIFVTGVALFDGVVPRGVDGVLGVALLEQMGTVDIDLDAGLLRYGPLREVLPSPPPECSSSVFRMFQRGALAFLDVKVAARGGQGQEVEMECLVHLGAPRSVLNTAGAEAAGVEASTTSAEVGGVAGAATQVKEATHPARVTFGDVTLPEAGVLVGDLPEMQALQIVRKPMMFIGQDLLLAKGRFVVAWQDRRVFVWT